MKSTYQFLFDNCYELYQREFQTDQDNPSEVNALVCMSVLEFSVVVVLVVFHRCCLSVFSGC